MENVPNKVVTINGIDDRGEQVIVHAGSEAYSFFKNKKDGGVTKAYETFQSLVKENSTVEVFYKTNGKYKNVVWFAKIDGSMIPNDVVPFHSKTHKQEDTERIEGMFNEKQDNIKWLNALNNATLLAANGKIELTDLHDKAIEIYGLKPIIEAEINDINPEEIPF